MPFPPEGATSTFRLIGSLMDDVRTLVRQEVALARAEARERLRDALVPLILLGAAASMLAAGGLWILIAVTRAFADLFVVPVWAAYAIVGLLLAIGGAVLIAAAQRRLHRLRFLPRTAASLREHAHWVAERAARTRSLLRS